LEERLLSIESRRKVVNIILRHLAANSYTYLQIIAAIVVKDYFGAYIILKKLFFKTAFQFLFTQAKSMKEKWYDKKRH